jgi:hypothetical protein
VFCPNTSKVERKRVPIKSAPSLAVRSRDPFLYTVGLFPRDRRYDRDCGVREMIGNARNYGTNDKPDKSGP